MARQRVLDSLHRQRAVLHGVNHRLDRRHLGRRIRAAQQHDVAPGRNGRNCCLGGSGSRADRFHVQIVGHNQSLVSERPLQHAVDNAWRDRGGPPIVERRNQYVRGHDRRHVGVDRRPERHQLHPLDPIGRMFQDGQFVMGIDAGIAMSGEMLAARRDAFGLQCPDDHAPEPRHLVGAFAQSAIADDGIRAVGVNVEHRREIQRDADRTQLSRQGPREARRQIRITAAPKRHHRRPNGERPLQPGDAPPFLIRAEPERPLVRQRSDLP